jgi:mannose-1-phosphate guanylyltransferase
MSSTVTVILAGGASSRLFPFNKILSDLSGSGKTLIQQAFARASAVTSRNQIYLLAVKDLVLPMTRQLKLPRNRFFVDPVRRGTWPALLWAMAHVRRDDPQAVMAVLTGDHIIPRLPAFRKAAQQACQLASKTPSVVMLGVDPGTDATEWTGYGVFRVNGTQVTAFAEKPALANARAMIKEGVWQWNSGMFFFRISIAEQALTQFQPDMYRQYERLCAAVKARKTREAQRLYAEFPAKIPHPLDPTRSVDNTIDFAIMTPLVQGPSALQALAVCGGLPIWTDLGQWEALGDVLREDSRKNLRLGVVTLDRTTQGCILAADRGYTLDVRGLSDAVIAVSARGLLILPRSELPRIKDHVAQAPAKKFLVVNALPEVHVKQSARKVVVSGTPFIR